MTADTIVLTLAHAEVRQLRQIVSDFAKLVAAPAAEDEALQRLTPSAYPEDQSAHADFAEATREYLLSRRGDDAGVVLATLDGVPSEHGAENDFAEWLVELDADTAEAWIRSLAAIRLIIASRLGIETAHHSPSDDPRFTIYDWLGYRLDALVQAAG